MDIASDGEYARIPQSAMGLECPGSQGSNPEGPFQDSVSRWQWLVDESAILRPELGLDPTA